MNKIIILVFFAFLSIINAKINTNEAKTTPTRLESLSKLHTVLHKIEKFYVSDLKFNEIIDKAIAGLMGELDAHSSYMNKKAYKSMNVQMKGEFGGLGIVIGIRDGALTVISPIDDTPAKKAGIQAGDIILKIKKQSTLKMTINEAVAIMRGKPGTPVDITIVRKGEGKPFKVNVIRDIIKVNSVKAKIINENILYLRISSFDNNVAKQLTINIKKYQKKTRGIILDLRNNPGGSLRQSIRTSNIFIDSGIIVSQKGRTKKNDEIYSATKNATLTRVPMVVLVNGGSASASEIVSGALQDSKRAVIIGEPTFGKGSVQALLPITKDRSEAIKLTIAKYYLPSGRTIQAKGIIPDIESFPGIVPTKKDNSFSIKEKDLKKHLEIELEKTKTKEEKDKNKKSKSKKGDKTIITKKEILKDNQLKTGIDVLKALMLFKR
jgi:carboxyl-terminal processing protease